MLDKAYHLNDADMAQILDTVFGACQVEFVVLNESLGKLVEWGMHEEGEGGMSRLARVRQVWNKQEMQNFFRNTQAQANGLNLVLSALQL